MNPHKKLNILIDKYQGYRINSIEELEKVCSEIRELKLYLRFMDFYRGQSLLSYELKSGLTRDGKAEDKINLIERNLYCHFNSISKFLRYYVRSPFKKNQKSYRLRNKWYKLFQAQHLGLKTRLMDWSINPIMALNFAVENKRYHGKDGTIHIFVLPLEYCYNQEQLKELTQNKDPFNINQDLMINTPVYLLDNKLEYVGERRMSRQSGRFWMQSIEKSNIPLDEQNEFKNMMIKLIIDGDSKVEIKRQLIENQSSVDWHYYRNEAMIDKSIKIINNLHFKHNLIQKILNYPVLAYYTIIESLRRLAL